MERAVKAVVFDIGNVVVRWDRRLPFLADFPDPAELDRFLDTVIPIDWHFQHDAGRPAAAMIAERSAQFPQHAPLIQAWFDRFNQSIPGPIPGMPELLQALADNSIPLFAITNFGADTWASYAPTQPLFAHFRDIVVSGIEKIAKPDPAIYELACRRFGHAPAEMLFIDDSWPNVEAARALGWRAHHFVGADGLRGELAGFGLIQWISRKQRSRTSILKQGL